jgi:hypothetical protein
MIDSGKILAGLPEGLRSPLLQSYQDIVRNYMEHRWEPSELNGGKFSEAVYSIVEGSLSGNFPATPHKPIDMVKACRALEIFPSDFKRVGDRSLRILIPRMLQPLYEIRNNRGVGHLGGDVDPNFLDSTVVYEMASWILAEIVRIFHAVSTKEAQEAVDELIERKHPLIWDIDDINIKRVLDPKMSKADQTLVLLHLKPSWVTEDDLFHWVEYSSLSMFRKYILKRFHIAKLIEFDAVRGRACISPAGCAYVEKNILKTM